MRTILHDLHSELIKLCCAKVTRIVTILVTALQGALAYISAKQILSVGLDAVPDGTNGLIEAIPPIEYLGFDVILFATIPMIVLGAVSGAAEYRLHCMRTTLICFGSKTKLFFTKTLAVTLLSFFVSALSAVSTIAVTHIALGEEGLTPLRFSPEVWKFMMLSAVSLTLLTLLAYVMGFLCRTAVIPLMFLIVQAYNIGSMLAERYAVCRLLPVALSNGMIASSQSTLTDSPALNISVLLIWIAVFGGAGYIIFRKSDLQGEY